MLTTATLDETARCSRFTTNTGLDEHFLTITTHASSAFDAALEELTRQYDAALSRCGLSDTTVVFSRLFVSDILNRKEAVTGSPLYGRLLNGAVSFVEQKPFAGGPLTLLSYHIAGNHDVRQKKQAYHDADGPGNALLLQGRSYNLFVTAGTTANASFAPTKETREIFASIVSSMGRHGLDFQNDAIRTWVFVRDIDNHYTAMVEARKEFFARYGLTDSTRYLASTGIGGSFVSPEKTVSIDSLAIGGLRTGQIIRMEAPDHLSPTILYGVTFERGLRVRFGDRSHLHISGTASIDNKGTVLHRGDARQQTARTLDNIQALLSGQGATLNDMAYLIVYIRTLHDSAQVLAELEKRVSRNTPCCIVEAPVCRPSWLVEIEGIAIIPDKNDFPQFL